MYPDLMPIEQKIKNLLIESGYEKKMIHFRECSGCCINIGNRYLRYGYWEYIPPPLLREISNKFDISFDEDDLGPKYCYHYK